MSRYPFRLSMNAEKHPYLRNNNNYPDQFDNANDFIYGQPNEQLCHKFLYGFSVPLGNLGRDGNLYLDLSTNKYYLKIDNFWRQQICENNGSEILTGIFDPFR